MPVLPIAIVSMSAALHPLHSCMTIFKNKRPSKKASTLPLDTTRGFIFQQRKIEILSRCGFIA